MLGAKLPDKSNKGGRPVEVYVAQQAVLRLATSVVPHVVNEGVESHGKGLSHVLMQTLLSRSYWTICKPFSHDGQS